MNELTYRSLEGAADQTEINLAVEDVIVGPNKNPGILRGDPWQLHGHARADRDTVSISIAARWWYWWLRSPAGAITAMVDFDPADFSASDFG